MSRTQLGPPLHFHKLCRTLPSWPAIIALVSCIAMSIIFALSTDFALNISLQHFLPFSFRIFTSRLDVFADSRLPTQFMWGRYNVELRLGPNDSNDALVHVLDYASPSSGSRIIESLTSTTYSPSHRSGYAMWTRMFSPGSGPDHSPAIALTEGMQPGQCWAFHGDSGQLGIQLPQAIRVSALTVGHANVSSAISAPKELVLWGLKPAASDFCTALGDVDVHKADFGTGYCGTRLISGVYKPSASTLYQNFTTAPDSKYHAHYFDRIIVEVLGNWGHPAFTCIYRIQIYGSIVH